MISLIICQFYYQSLVNITIISQQIVNNKRHAVGVQVVTGNGQGLAGFGLGKAKEAPAALRKAKNRAGQKLMHFEIYDGHTSKNIKIRAQKHKTLI